MSPAPDGAAKPPGETAEARETTPREAIEQRAVLQPHAEADEDENVVATPEPNQNPRRRGERLERRLQAVVSCLEATRQVVVAAEVAGAGIEAVRPAVHALQRSEAALREAQAQLLRGDVARVDSPLDAAEAACRAARASATRLKVL